MSFVAAKERYGKKGRASFEKVIAFDLLFLALGGLIGAGIITAVLLR